MSTKSDRHEILNSLDAQYTSDLGIHLYSTFLLRRVNPLFPPPHWSSWPLPLQDVPVPQDEFADDTVAGYAEDIDSWQAQYVEQQTDWKAKNERKVMPLLNPDPNPENHSSSSDDEEEEEEEGEEHVQDIGIRDKIVEISYKQNLPNAKTALANAISSVLQCKITARIQSMKQAGTIPAHLEPSDAISDSPVLSPVINEIGSRFNAMLDSLDLLKKRMKEGEGDWMAVLLAAVLSRTNSYLNLNTGMYRRLFERCNSLFNEVDYRFEFEEEDEKEEEDNGKIISSTGAFNVNEYIKSLADKDILAKYNHLASTYLESFNTRRQEQGRITCCFMRALDVQDKYKRISWDNSHTGSKTKRRRQLEPDGSNAKDVMNDILGSTELNENTYTLNL
ncbi:hypothetical protein Cantr_02319 [Candida viswanathii]|uniref:Rrn9 domain-containing protein n=1 Tax=Candida viswanathii TaxID=5486 RepID=A0A367YMB2_9ASCO|nr:hypothetical protein Cantr_02319 [Candida viswanathii]